MFPLVLPLAPTAVVAADEAVRFEYRAPPGVCPSQSEFTAMVRARTSRWHLADAGESARTFVVEVSADAQGTRGRLSIVGVEHDESERELAGPGCDTVVNGIALMTALAIDPEASTGAVVVPAAAPSVEQPPPARPPAVPASTSIESRWQTAVGGGLGAVTLFPELAPSAHAFMEVSRLRRVSLSPSVRAQVAYARSPLAGTPSSHAQLDWIDAGLSACPWLFQLAGPPPDDRLVAAGLYVQPCFSASLGMIRGVGVDVPHAQSRDAMWLDVGALVRVRWLMGELWFLSVEGGTAFPLLHPAFHVDATSPSPPLGVYTTPLAVAVASASVGVRFP
jgi:hypothetical protein